MFEYGYKIFQWFKAVWNIAVNQDLTELKLKLLAEHLKDVIIRISALEGKSESGTVKSRLDDLTTRVELLEKGEG